MRNVEFKAELRDLSLARAIVGRLGGSWAETIRQRDTYFRVPSGRLKRREIEGEATEWIEYDRPEGPGSRISEYTIRSEEEALAWYGEMEIPTWAVVVKVREVYLLGNVRIHLDRVEGLGDFIEFEAVLARGAGEDEERAARASLKDLRERLGPVLGEAIAVGYADLVAGNTPDATRAARGGGGA